MHGRMLAKPLHTIVCSSLPEEEVVLCAVEYPVDFGIGWWVVG